jgi:hypothetical protein
VEDASLATSRWCRPRDCRRRGRWGTPTVVAAIVAGVIVLAFPLALALILAFAAVVGVGGSRGRARLGTRRFLLWWARRQCCRYGGRRVERGGLSLGR